MDEVTNLIYYCSATLMLDVSSVFVLFYKKP